MKKTVIAVAVLIILAAPLVAQSTEPAPAPVEKAAEPPAAVVVTPFSNFIDLGLGLVDFSPRSAKFVEYRDVPEGAFGPSFRVSTESPRTVMRLSGSNLNQADRRIRAYVDTPVVRAEVMYDQIPHRFGFDAHSIETRVSRDEYRIADTTQQQFQTTLTNTNPRSQINFNFLRNLVEPALRSANAYDLELRRDRGTLELQILPDATLDSRITYFQENRNGTRGAGTSFGFGNVVETPEPVDYTTREVGLNAEYPIRNGFVRGALRMNEFSNALRSYTFDNPFRITDSTDASAYQAPGSASINGPVMGRISLPPDNRAVNAAAGVLYKLPMNSRVSADLGIGRWTQDERFIPYTANTAITEALAPLPASSLNGQIDTTTLNLQLTSKPIRNTSFVARYRTYDLDNETPRLTIPGYVRFDSSWNPNARITVPYSWSTRRGELIATYDFAMASVEGGLRHETIERAFRETEETKENVWRLAGDIRPTKWMMIRASYEAGNRRFDEYDSERGEDASFVVHPTLPGNLPALRRFDQANRDTDRTVVMLQLTPLDVLTFSFNATRYTENYDGDSDYGLLKVRNNSISGDADYSPNNRLSIFAFATIDEVRGFQRGRQSAATVSTNPLDDWTADNTDEAGTFGAGAHFAVVPERIGLQLTMRYQKVDGFAALSSPPGGAPDVAFSIPQVDDTRIFTTILELDYRLAQAWELGVGGWIERYRIRDAQTTGSQTYMPGGFFLAENNGDYHGNVVYLRATYRF